MIPEAKLALMCHPMNPPKPIGVNVVVNGQAVAAVSLEEIDRLYGLYRTKLEAWRASFSRVTLTQNHW